MTNFTTLTSAVNEVLNQHDQNYYRQLLPQIEELVDQGILEIDLGTPQLVYNATASFEIRQSVKLIYVKQDEIDKLKAEISRLTEIVDGARYS